MMRFMNNIAINDLIYMTYLTNYNIGMMYDALSEYSNRDSIMNYCIEKMKLNHVNNDKAIENTKIAIQKLKYHRIKAVSIFDDNYPKNLKKIEDAPPILYIKGNFKEVKNAAVVGSRKVSGFADVNTKKVINWLSEEGFSIISGLAEGIDTFAHIYALKNNQYTIAVLPNSLDSIYPKTNYSIANDILQSDGCLISETIFNINRGKRSFVQRNRIQSALSDVVIPIEMGVNSGTMHTINFAKRYKKKILVSKINDECRALEQYSGIQSLITNQSKYIALFDDEKSFKRKLLIDINEQTKLNF